jgi:hypothetical protein
MENICVNGIEWMRAGFSLLIFALLSLLTGFVFVVRKRTFENTTFTISMLFPVSMAFFMMLTAQLTFYKVNCESLHKLDMLAWPTAFVSYILGTTLFFIRLKKRSKSVN